MTDTEAVLLPIFAVAFIVMSHCLRKDQEKPMRHYLNPDFILTTLGFLFFLVTASAAAQPSPSGAHDGAHDFDFLIGDWKAHVRRLPDRLNGSHSWVTYDGVDHHHKLLDSSANFEDFEVDNLQLDLHMRAQTLRLYNPATQQWSIYPVDLALGTLDTPPVVGRFTDHRGEFYHQENFKGRVILVRYVWFDLTPKSSRMEQSFSDDGGKSWEVNWICELSR